MTDPRLGRRPEFDPRSRDFPIRTMVAGYPPRGYTWSVGVRLDQGQEGSCVGHAVVHEAAARPAVVAGVGHATAVEVYRRAQQLDEWPGESYSGTSVLAGMKAGQEHGWYPSYRWAFGLDDLILALGYFGPGVAGLNWYEGMMTTDADGFVRVAGGVAGGHAILVNGVSVSGQYVKLVNSWGPGWGVDGTCKMTFADLDRLLHESGEFAIPVKRSKG